MAMKRTPRPRDPVQLGKLMVDIATGAVPDAVNSPEHQRKAGQKGGQARATILTPEQRTEIARTAASVRWKKGG